MSHKAIDKSERNQLIVKLYGEYFNLKAIGERVGLSGERVRRVLIAAGVSTRGWNQPPKPVVTAIRRNCRNCPPAERFWSKVDRSGGADACWLWIAKTKSKDKRYGRMFLTGKTRYAHHLAWFFAQGEFSSHWLLHCCGQSLCCNPGHLKEGTRAESIRERGERGRTARGEKSGLAKLTASQVLAIRKRAREPEFSPTELAAEYGVHKVTISNIVRNQTWRHLPNEITTD